MKCQGMAGCKYYRHICRVSLVKNYTFSEYNPFEWNIVCHNSCHGKRLIDISSRLLPQWLSGMIFCNYQIWNSVSPLYSSSIIFSFHSFYFWKCQMLFTIRPLSFVWFIYIEVYLSAYHLSFLGGIPSFHQLQTTKGPHKSRSIVF